VIQRAGLVKMETIFGSISDPFGLDIADLVENH